MSIENQPTHGAGAPGDSDDMSIENQPTHGAGVASFFSDGSERVQIAGLSSLHPGGSYPSHREIVPAFAVFLNFYGAVRLYSGSQLVSKLTS